MKQVITIELDEKEWKQAIADYIKVDVSEIKCSDYSKREIQLTKPLHD